MLTQKQADNAKAGEKRRMLFDRDGLYLRIQPNGKKIWVVRQWNGGKEKLIRLGEHPFMTLAEARYQRYQLKESGGIPRQTFGEVWQLWTKKRSELVGSTTLYFYSLALRYLDELKDRQIDTITRPVLASAFLRLAENHTPLICARCAQLTAQVFAFAVDLGLIDFSPAQRLKALFPQHHVTHYTSATTHTAAGELFRRVEDIGSESSRTAVKMIMYSLCRSQECRLAKWSEFDFENRLWTIPAEHTKRRRTHIVPMSVQLIKLLTDWRVHYDGGPLVFPSPTNRRKSITAPTLLQALRNVTAGSLLENVTIHGFRATGSTLLHESGKFPHEVIEAQLAHITQSAVSAAYNRAEYTAQRREMMQFWSDSVDSLRDTPPQENETRPQKEA